MATEFAEAAACRQTIPQTGVFVGIIGGYEMHVYCDDPGHDSRRDGARPLELAGINRRDCLRQLARRGWTLKRNAHSDMGAGWCVCPSCLERAT